MAKKGKYCYDYPRPALSTDIIFFLKDQNDVFVLLIERKHAPFKHAWALPGGFVDPKETTLEAAKRELKEETGITADNLIQFQTFSEIDRDPRGRVVSVVYYCITDEKPKLKPGDDAKNAQFFSVKNLPSLAFDHDKIMESALKNVTF